MNQDRHRGFLLAIAVLLLLSSRTFVEYQTSGLETSLTHLLVVALWSVSLSRSRRGLSPPIVAAAWLCALLLLNRPDHLFLCALVVLFLLVDLIRKGSRRRWLAVLSALLPLVIWYGFATIYYGTPLPNTAYAKVTMTLSEAWPRGLLFVWHYCRHEPVHALVVAVVMSVSLVRAIGGLRQRRTGAGLRLALTLGVIAHLLYVISIGGDFMHGRFLMPVLLGSAVLGIDLLASFLSVRDPVRLAALAVGLTGIVLTFAHAPSALPLASLGEGLAAVQYEFFANRPAAIIAGVLMLALWVGGAWLTGQLAGLRSRWLFLILSILCGMALTSMIGACQPSWSVTLVVFAALGLSATACASAGGGRGLDNPATLVAAGLVVAAVGSLCDVNRPREGSQDYIDDVYSYYYLRGWHNPFRHPTEALRGRTGEGLRVGRIARRYAEDHGPVTIACRSLGIPSYYAGPAVSIIDLYGLTDPYIARSPAPPGRKIGHTRYDVPIGYLQARGAINLLPDGLARMGRGDPSLVADADRLRAHAHWLDEADRCCWQEVQEVITGPLFERDRLRQILRFMLARSERIGDWPAGESPQERFGLRLE